MFIDARSLPDGEALQADVCIIGAGAAGITLARELGRAGIKTCVLEAGGLEFDDRTQALYEGDVVGREYFDLTASRLRYFGGTTNHWGGMCRPFDEIDFKYRPWMPYSGWPFDRSELVPYYEVAREICQLSPAGFDLEHWEDSVGSKRWPFDEAAILTRMFQFLPLRFGEAYRDELGQSATARVYLNANVVAFDLDADGGRVERLQVRAFDDKSFTAAARHFVLATGGIENARLLMLPNERRPAGIGNHHDLVGRFFMEHIDCSWKASSFRFLDERTPSRLYSYQEREGTTVRGALTLSDSVMEQEKIANYCTLFDIIYSQGVPAARHVMEDIRRGEMPDHLGELVVDIATDLDSVTDYALRKWFGFGLFEEGEDVEEVKLFNFLEQAPNPDSRVMLSDKRDEFGLNRVELDWQLTEFDWLTLKRGQEVIARELGRLGLGRFKMEISEDPNVWPDETYGVNHHIGTTRMHDSEQQGVVDRNCRIHSVSNLHVAGSSVFPTSGYANPTLTIVALAVRLADHIKAELS